jgi:hypothetical protein
LIFNSPDTIYFINVVDINYFVNGKLKLINVRATAARLKSEDGDGLAGES